MTFRAVVLSLVIGATGCGLKASIDRRLSEESCRPAPATLRMACVGLGERLVYMDGGKICDPRGGEIRIKGAECVLVPIASEPAKTCLPAPATHEMQCPYAAAIPVRFDDGLICDPDGGEIDDRDAGCLFYPIVSEVSALKL